MADPRRHVTIYVVEDDASVRRSLIALLSANGYEAVPCASAEEFLRKLEPRQKCCLVLDLRLPGMSGIELQAYLTDIDVDIPVVILTAHGDIPLAVQAMRTGAVDFIEKPAGADRLLEAIRTAGFVANNEMVPEVPPNVVEERFSKLTDREKEVLRYLLLGKLNKEIAGRLGVSRRTIEVHRSRIREKMRARGIADLVRMFG